MTAASDVSEKGPATLPRRVASAQAATVPDRAPAGCSYGYLSGRLPRMLLGCLAWVRRRPKSHRKRPAPILCDPFLPTRYGAAESEPAFEPIEAELTKQSAITVPTIVLHGEGDGVSPPRSSERHDRFFTGPYERRVVPLRDTSFGQQTYHHEP